MVLITSLSKKDLYFHLCHNPIIINNGTMVKLRPEEESGKKCYIVGAKGLSIYEKECWTFTSLPAASFVAGAKFLWCFDVEARIDTRSHFGLGRSGGLLPSQALTNCVPHLIFKFSDFKYAYASERIRIEFGVYIDGIDNEERRKHIKMGAFFNEDEDDGMLTCRPNDFDSPLQQVLNRCTRN
ncbi:F-box protein PP2-B11 [Citrus sinensis]|uniref:F-box protein PP2-B11 n=1 Tax=Citrus sinensis TaxID=2711 RepID=A0ACB8I1D0_CITSI|nr:F-box protein PP2-B11 [Citrus sinensis]